MQKWRRRQNSLHILITLIETSKTKRRKEKLEEIRLKETFQKISGEISRKSPFFCFASETLRP
jgi:hypothetical protein